MRQQFQRLTYFKSDQSKREEYKKMLNQKITIIDQEFTNYSSEINHIQINQQQDIEKNFKKELDILVESNAQKEQHLNNMIKNQALSLMNQYQNTEKKKKEVKNKLPKRQLSIEIKQTERLLPIQNQSPVDDFKKNSFFIYPAFTEEMIQSKKQLTMDSIFDSLLQNKNNPEIIKQVSEQQIDNQSIQKEQSQLDYLKQRYTDIQNQIESAEKEAIFENSTNDQYKFQVKKYETVCQVSQNNLNYKNNQLKILQETEQETLEAKKQIYDEEKQELLQQKKKVCEILIKIDFLSEQKKSQLSTIENLEDQKIFLYEQKQLSCYVEQNIDALAKLSEIFLDRKINLNEEEIQQRYLSSPQTPMRTSRSRMTKFTFALNKSIQKNDITSIDDLDSLTNRSSQNSPKPQRFIQNQIIKIKQESKIHRQNSLQIERNRKVDKINRFCENNPSKLIDDLIQIYQQLVLQNQSLQSQFEFLQKQKIQQNVEIRNLDSQIQEIYKSISEAEIGSLDLKKKIIQNQQKDEQQCLMLELDKATELKNELETILVNALYFLLLTLGRHKRLIDDVNEKGDIRVESDTSFDKFEKIDLILDKYQKGFMKKKIFEQFNNKKKFKNHSSSITLQKNLINFLQNQNNYDEDTKNGLSSKEKFFFFMEQHNYFPLTTVELKQTLSFVFPKSFNLSVIEQIIDLTSNDILIRFFLSKDDIIEVIEKCFNTYEYFKQFNMILSNYEQLFAYSKKQKLQPQGKTPHGSRRLSQYSPFKNPHYILQKEESSSKTPKKDKKFSLKLEIQGLHATNSLVMTNQDSESKIQDKNSQNIIENECKETPLMKVNKSISFQSQRNSIEIAQNSQNTEEEDSQLSKKSLSSKSSSDLSDCDSNSKNSKYLSKINESPLNSIIYDETDEIDQDEREEQALLFKYEEQSILGQFIILQLQKRSIKNFKITIKEVIDSEKYIFAYIKRYFQKNHLEENRKGLIKAHYLDFNKQQLQSFISQAEKTLQFKKQREQLLNDKIKESSDKVQQDDGEDEDDDNFNEDQEEEEKVFEKLNTWKQCFSPITPSDHSSKFRQAYMDQMSISSSLQKQFIQKETQKLMNDSFIMEESQVFGTNQSLKGENQEKNQQTISKFQQKKEEEVLKEELDQAKNFIILLSDQNKQRMQPTNNFNLSQSSFKFKKIDTNEQNKKNSTNLIDQTQKNELNKTIKSKKSVQNQIQVFQENKRNKDKKEADFIDSQRMNVKNEIQSVQNKVENNQSLNSLNLDFQKKQQQKLFDFENLSPIEQQFQKYVEAEENYYKDLKNQDYFVENLKTFHNDAFFLQKIFILGKNSSSVNLIKKNSKLELPKGLQTAKYFQKLQDFERKKYKPTSQTTQCTQPQEQTKNIQEIEKKQTNEIKQSMSLSLKSQQINAIYSKFTRNSSISEQVQEIKSVLDSVKQKQILNIGKQNGEETNKQPSNLENNSAYKVQIDTLKQQDIKNNNKDYIVADKIQNSINQKLESIKVKNMKSLEQLKKIFNVYDSDFSINKNQLKHQSSNSTVNSRINSKKNSSSFQSQMTSPFISNCQSYNTSDFDYTKSSQVYKNISHNKSKSYSNSNFVFQQPDKIISQTEAMKKITEKPSPYVSNPFNFSKIKPRQNKISEKNITEHNENAK
ncbi:hypothetical protein TTHERM_00578650 (macronuclear) [Tetrahymena thermophila SB210]|uniref:Uncharacterized protein n=1 Tax=Tetrahymena thermophila (strain SB210) TaxID=312017 RepID=I7M377_TETTS|nr:hypothetical protein TTHERM_00578650 [Tetrahymena thermophila SB210]EAS02621.2 hypothetical protein TTHERM_00578650 [Tetrahymena thermophila SB210]|eukprot:XP_001022866.2 hypothetical protein TTHERM_00578650 [Tetrahymena thermophila SB210]